MLTRLLRTYPAPITAIGLLGGFALMMTGNRSFAIAGAVLIFFGLLVPFLQLPTKRDEPPHRQSVDHPETPRSIEHGS